MDKLSHVFKDKIVEVEFKSPTLNETDEISKQVLVDEIRTNQRRARNIDVQAEHLYARLRYIQKNYYDDMEIIDAYSPAKIDPPWKSKVDFTRNKYQYWDVRAYYMSVRPPHIMEVVIRKEGHERDIKVLDAICKRLETLDNMAGQIYHRNKEIKTELVDKYGSGDWTIVPTDHE